VDAGISKSEVSRICVELDVAAFRSRSLSQTSFPYVFVDATYLKARVDGRVWSRAVVIATGVTADGGREVLGVVGIFPNDAAVLAWPARCWSRRTTSGRWLSGATCRRARWPNWRQPAKMSADPRR
jgi:hypothetical protein